MKVEKVKVNVSMLREFNESYKYMMFNCVLIKIKDFDGWNFRSGWAGLHHGGENIALDSSSLLSLGAAILHVLFN